MPKPAPTTQRAETTGGLIRVVVAGLVWGTIPLVIRYADGASVIKVFFRVVFALLGLGVWMTATGRLSEIWSLPLRKLGQVAVQGAILTLNWVLFLSALEMTNVATAELLAYTAPVLVAALAPFVTGERYDLRILLPLGLSLGGGITILAPQGLGVASPRELLGAAMALASSATYAALLLRSKRILADISGGALMMVEYVVAGALSLPFVLWAYSHGQGPANPATYGWLLALGLVHTAFTGVLFLGGLRRVRTDHAAILTYAEPASAVVFAALFLGEPLTAWTLAGGAMVVAGGLAVARLAPLEEPVPLEAAGGGV